MKSYVLDFVSDMYFAVREIIHDANGDFSEQGNVVFSCHYLTLAMRSFDAQDGEKEFLFSSGVTSFRVKQSLIDTTQGVLQGNDLLNILSQIYAVLNP